MSTAYNVIIFSFALTGLILGIVALTKTPQIGKNTDAIGKNTDAIGKNTDAIANSKFYLNNTKSKQWPFGACHNSPITADNAWVSFGLLDKKGGIPAKDAPGMCSSDGEAESKTNPTWQCDYSHWIGKRASYFNGGKGTGNKTTNPTGLATPDQLKKCYESPGCEVQSNLHNMHYSTCMSRYAV